MQAQRGEAGTGGQQGPRPARGAPAEVPHRAQGAQAAAQGRAGSNAVARTGASCACLDPQGLPVLSPPGQAREPAHRVAGAVLCLERG